MKISDQTFGVIKNLKHAAYSKLETVINSYECARICIEENIPGCFIECGVAAGSQIGAMMLAAREKGQEREFYLYDSFCGIPLAGPKDNQQPGIGPIRHDVNVPERKLLVSSGITVHDENSVKNNLKMWGLGLAGTCFIKGWFQDTVPKNNHGPIAVLRLDGDLYSSTKICLDYLYKKVVPGGFVIIDDYALLGCKTAVDEFMGTDKFNYNVVTGTNKVIWWRK